MALEPKKRRGGPPPKGLADRMNSGTLCRAHRRDGEPCGNFAMRNSTVCRKHGGAAPQTLRAAQVRAIMSTDILMAELVTIALDKKQSARDRIQAIVHALDRGGLTTKQTVEITGEVSLVEENAKKVFIDRDMTYGDEDDDNTTTYVPTEHEPQTYVPTTMHMGELQAQRAQHDVEVEARVRRASTRSQEPTPQAAPDYVGETYQERSNRLHQESHDRELRRMRGGSSPDDGTRQSRARTGRGR